MEIASHEAIIRKAYKDSEGFWTWSVGMTNATGHNVERYIDNPAPLTRCLEVYVWALDNYAKAVREVFEGYELSEAQFAAALSFHWNTGGIKKATWVRHWKAGKYGKARRAFMAWNKPKSIVGRRRKERDLFFDGKWSNTGTMVEYTRLTRRYSPVWSSAKRINVEADLQRIIKGRYSDGGTVFEQKNADRSPKPDAPVNQPTISPSEEEGNKYPIFRLIATIAEIIADILKRSK